MKKQILILSAVLGLILSSACIKKEDLPEPKEYQQSVTAQTEITLDILIGQSNAVGTELNTSISSAYPYLLDTIPGSLIYNPVTKNLEKLGYWNCRSTSGRHGIELSYMYGQNQKTGQTRCLVKHAVGNTSLGVDLTKQDWNASSNELLKASMTYAKTARTKLQALGYTVNIGTVMIYQGETDAGDSTWSSQYDANSVSLQGYVKTQLGDSTIKFCYIQIHNVPQYASVVRASQYNQGTINGNYLYSTDGCMPNALHPTGTCLVGFGFDLANLLP